MGFKSKVNRDCRSAVVIPLLASVLLTGCIEAIFGPGETRPDASVIPWAGLDGKIAFAFASRVDEGSHLGQALYVMDTGARKLDKVKEWRAGGSTVSISGLDWSPDGRQMVFALERTEPSQLLRIDRDGKNEQVLFPDPNAWFMFPSWSSQGRIAYLLSDGAQRIHEIHVDNTLMIKCERLSGHLCEDGPNWSANGRSLFVATRDSADQGTIYRVDVSDGTSVRLRTGDNPVQEMFLVGSDSPQDGRIAFVSITQEEGAQIWSMAADGTDAERITSPLLGSATNPVWSPDGSRILFLRGAGMYVMDADGGRETLVLSSHWAHKMAWTQ